ncbi:hypothetical protein AB0M54_37245 [Actinoplanes sp. NPDC051470]|uniref:hypothetical protein n=1 Tax=Actinoplanes sp. NPDC051470 TaxID=3157224 RepID=UPI0034362D89
MPIAFARRAWRRHVAILVVLGVVGAGCESGGSATAEGQAADRSADAAVSVAGVCPGTVVIQTNWWPQAEYGGLYRLLGRDVRIDTSKKLVSAPLVASGADTGVRIEIRSGGPANNFTPASKLLYVDRSVTLAGSDLDQAAQFSKESPVTAVFAPMDLSPLVLMWDPQTYPAVKTIADVGRAGARVLTFQGSTYVDYLTGAGILRKSQVEGSYDGTPARFVAEKGKVVQQGYLTNEVYAYEQEISQWKKKVGWALVNDAGYPNYPEALTVRQGRRTELASCLEKLVPILQMATVGYVADPKPTNDLLVRLADEYGAYPYSAARAAHAVTAMKDNRLLGNGANATIGDFERERVQRIVDVVTPIFAGQRQPVKDGLSADDLFTNEFIDTTVSLP